MKTNIEQVALLREAAKGCHPKYSNGLRVLADSLEAQGKAEPNLQPKDMSQAKRFISQLEGEVERLKAENEELRRLNKEANKIITIMFVKSIIKPLKARF